MLKQKYFLTGIFILSAERQPIKLSWRKIVWLHKFSPNPIRIWIDIRISNGLHLTQKNLSYQDLVRMVEKLEGLC